LADQCCAFSVEGNVQVIEAKQMRRKRGLRGRVMRKPILVLVLAGVVSICGAISASAAGTPLTITFYDGTNALWVYPTGSGSCGVSSIGEACTVILTPPSGYSFGSTTLPPIYLIGEKTGTGTKVISDSLLYAPVLDPYTLTFLSSLVNVLPCPTGIVGIGGCLIDNGTVQTLGTITWTKTGFAPIVETINFQSGVNHLPEPASLVLFGSGLGITAVFLRRRRRLVTPSV
jgi:hypothetical protein